MARFVRLDRMEIVGFKSFYGRTRFDFPEGITAVVGPNGCGKSNIGDAISWVLGEQRASSLRSDRMEDVIFSGSEGRRPLGMAEVSLHFKNLGAPPGATVGGNGNGGRPAPRGRRGGNGRDPLAPPATDRVVSSGPLSIPEVHEAAAEGPRPGARFVLEDLPEDVVVTRRLYRSGDSEYALNGRRCRLRDVQDLLARTEIGSRLYSSIEQGRIDQILTAKPKDRRGVIEEAAGILGYKTRRRQAEQKLEAAQANLLRISDITGEVERQINSLKRQAARARRYQSLRETLHRRRAVIAHRRFIALDADRRAAHEAVADLKRREAAAAAGLARLEAQVEDLRRRLEHGEGGSRLRRDAIHALDMEIDRIKQGLRSDAEQARELAARVEAAGRDLVLLHSGAAEIERRIVGLRDERGEEMRRLEEAEAALESVESRRLERARDIERREQGLESARGGLLRQVDRIAGLTRTRAALEEQLRSRRSDLGRLERGIAESSRAAEALGAAAGALEKEISRHSSEMTRRARERDARLAEEGETAERLATLERRVEEMKGHGCADEERLRRLRALEERHEGYGKGVAEILNGRAGVAALGVVGERIDVPPGLERAVAAALGRLLEAVLVRDAEDALRAVQHVRRSAAGRVAVVPRQPVGAPGGTADGSPAIGRAAPPPSLSARAGVRGRLIERVSGAAPDGPVAAVLSRTILVDDLRLAVGLEREHPGFAFVTPEGDIVGDGGVVTGGEGPELQHGVLARRAEMAELARQIASSQEARAAAARSAVALRQELFARRRRAEAAGAELREGERALLEVELKLLERRRELARAEAALPLLRRDKEETWREIDDLAVRAIAAAATIAAAEVRRREMEEAIRDGAERVTELRIGLERIQAQASDARARMAAGMQKIAAIDRELDAAAARLEETRGRAGRLATEAEEWRARVEALRGRDAALERRLEELLASRAEAAAGEEAALAGLSYDRSLLHAREAAAREGRSSREACRERLQERELQLARLEADLGHLAAGCREDLGLSVEDLCASPPEIEPGRTVEDYEREIGEIRASLERMGPVNLMAIEQFTELEERYAFLSAQKRDLEDSIASLGETIRKIDRDSRERFTAALEAIQASFQDCFAALFGGGGAELRLQDEEEDVLEAGIEIVAQPPGKRLQSIALLSGGERALTVVALLFALFRYRPSPFCVLDEVDAPLDEANIDRFTRLLQEMREQTQFILITHNRKSMEAADLLYGVTMEEPGVSKVLPLRFE